MSERNLRQRFGTPAAVLALGLVAFGAHGCGRQPNPPEQFARLRPLMPSCDIKAPAAGSQVDQDLQRDICKHAGSLVTKLLELANSPDNPFIVDDAPSAFEASGSNISLHKYGSDTSYLLDFRAGRDGHPDPAGFESITIQRNLQRDGQTVPYMGETIRLSYSGGNWALKDQTLVYNNLETDESPSTVVDYFTSLQHPVKQPDQVHQILASISDDLA